MSFAYVVAYFSLPLIALGAGCFVILRRRKVRELPPSNVIGLVAAFSIIVPLPLVFAYAHATEANLLVEDLIFILGGGVLLLLLRYFRKASSVRVLGFVGIGFVLLGAYNITGDFLRSRSEISGTVTHKYITHGRGSMSFYVVINGRSFPTTLDLYKGIVTESQVKAEIGQASGTIFEITEM